MGETGSVRDALAKRRMTSFMLLYKLAVKFPPWVTTVLLKTRLYRILFLSAGPFGLLIRLWGVDKRDWLYVVHYGRYLKTFFARKFRRASGTVHCPAAPRVQ